MPLSETLDALDELMSSNAVQATVAQLEWKHTSKVLGARVPARFADLVGGTGNEESRATGNADVRAILEADAPELPRLLETYIRSIWHERSEPRLRGSIRSNSSSASVSIS